MASTFSSHFHDTQLTYRFQFSNSVPERSESPLNPGSPDLLCWWLCESSLGVSNRRSYVGTETMDQASCTSRDVMERDLELSLC